MKYFRATAALVCLIVAGHLTSRPPFSGLPFVFLPLLAWLQLRERTLGPWYVFAFFLGVGIKIPFAVFDVGAGIPLAATIWLGYGLVAAVASSVVPKALQTDSRAVSAWVFFSLSIPGLGFVFVAPPVASAGWLFPGTGLVGIALLVWFGGKVIDAVERRSCRPLVIPALLVAGCNVAHVIAPPAAVDVSALSMPVPQPPANLARSILASVRFSPAVHAEYAKGAQKVVLPENVLGLPTPTTVALLDVPADRTLIAGGIARVAGFDSYQKGVWVFPAGIFYPAIQPIPVIEPGLRPHWSALHKIANIGGEKYSLLVCFEASTSLPLYHLGYGRPIILVGNGWWDRSGIMDIEVGLAHSWARLFHSSLAVSRGFPQI
ncbi:hypothetical protein [Burkholderia sp. Ac-20365]|uniref:hypothetical protein n=1 Tax=Burkholderia sp. Ac-20365 TaxID=2703897 RepID=UPI00197BBE34|nr:hypothetical protein [Burkholderia sp. Ac-20365]MBN3760955.1 hypothetical protein [Burkholderia sp. Ac-20365]